MSLQRNGEVAAAGYSYVVDATSERLTFSVDATLKLNVGDAITIFIYDGAIFSTIGCYTHFAGSLLEEDLFIS